MSMRWGAVPSRLRAEPCQRLLGRSARSPCGRKHLGVQLLFIKIIMKALYEYRKY